MTKSPITQQDFQQNPTRPGNSVCKTTPLVNESENDYKRTIKNTDHFLVVKKGYFSVHSFALRLASAVRRCGNPVLVGLDPRLENLPSVLQPEVTDFESQARAYRDFCFEIIDVLADLVPAVKPQAAFFEELGPYGLSALHEVILYARDHDLLVILDGKRNDIGSTAVAYARAYIGGSESAWQADALTVNPYLGDDSLQPFIDTAVESDTGVFVLVKTSNPGGSMFQDLRAEGLPLYQHVAWHVACLASQTIDDSGYGAIGAVVGATYPDELAELRQTMKNAWILVPGFGSQGGSAHDVRPAFDETGLGAIINSSRAIIFAYQRPEFRDRFGPQQWQTSVEAAANAMIDELRSETPVGEL